NSRIRQPPREPATREGRSTRYRSLRVQRPHNQWDQDYGNRLHSGFYVGTRRLLRFAAHDRFSGSDLDPGNYEHSRRGWLNGGRGYQRRTPAPPLLSPSVIALSRGGCRGQNSSERRFPIGSGLTRKPTELL